MARELSATFQARYALLEQGFVINCVEILTATPIRIHNGYDVAVTVDGDSYEPYGELLRLPALDEYPLNSGGMEIVVNNMDDAFSSVYSEYQDKIIVNVYEVLLDDDGAVDDYRLIYAGRINSLSWDEEWFKFTVRPGVAIGARMTPEYAITCWRRFGGNTTNSSYTCIYDGARLTGGPPCNKTIEDCRSMVFAAQADGGNSGLTSDITSGGDYDPTLDAGTITITITSTTGFSWSNSAGGSGTGTISTSPQTPQVSAGWEITFPQDPFPAGAIGDVWTFQVNNEENFGGERFCPEPGDTIEFADGQRRQLPINWTSGTDDDETGDDGNHDGGGGGTNQAKRWIFIPVTDPNTGYWYNTATGDRIAGTRNNPPF